MQTWSIWTSNDGVAIRVCKATASTGLMLQHLCWPCNQVTFVDTEGESAYPAWQSSQHCSVALPAHADGEQLP